MAQQSIYTVGGTVQAGSGLYIPRQADQQLLELCRSRTFAYVLTPRQMGKSSLMVRTAEQLRDEDVCTAIVDLQPIGASVSQEEWYLGLLTEIEEQLDLDTDLLDWWEDRAHLGFAQRLTRFFKEVVLTEIDGPVVVFIDEIDTTLSLDFTDDFFIALRYFYTDRAQNPEFHRLSFVLIGVATPADLIRDSRRTPFNVGQRVDLTDFTPQDAAPLAAGLGLPDPDAQQVLTQILQWTSGHPYLTQRLCQAVTEDIRNQGLEVRNQKSAETHNLQPITHNERRITNNDIDHIVAATFFGTMANRDNNLQFVRDMLTQRAPDLYAVLTTYRDIWRKRRLIEDEEQSPIKSHLKLSGIVKQDADRTLRVRNDIYATVFDGEWIRENLPVNWRKRIKRLQGAIAASVVLMGLMGGLMTWALWERGRATAALEDVEEERDRAEGEAARAEAEAQRAEAEARNAEVALDEAEKQQQLAEQRQQEAEIATQQAEEQRQQAEAQQQQAEIARLSEAEQRRIAEQQRLGAEQARLAEAAARKDAEEGRIVAEAATESAEKATLRAEKQQQIALARQLAAQADSTRRLRGNLLPASILLAVEAIQRFLAVEETISIGSADAALRHYTLLAPQLALYKDASSITFSPDGRYLAMGNDDGTITLQNLRTEETRLIYNHASNVNTLKFSADSSAVVSISNDGLAVVQRLADIAANPLTIQQFSGQLETSQYLDQHVENKLSDETLSEERYFAIHKLFGEAGQRIFIKLKSNDFDTYLYLLNEEGQLIASDDDGLDGWNSGANIVLPTTGDYEIVVSSYKAQEIGRYELSIQLGTQGIALGEHTSEVRAIAFSPDGERVATASWDATARIWNSVNGIELARLNHEKAVQSVAFSPDGERVATASGDATARIWDATDGTELARLSHGSAVQSVAFSPDGEQVATASGDATARIWDATDGTELARLNHGSAVQSVAFSPNGERVATTSLDNTARVWNVVSGAELVRLNHDGIVQSVVFSLDGERVATASGDATARVWNAVIGTELARLNHGSAVQAVTFSPDGEQVATASFDDTARVWNANSSTEMARLDHDSVVQAVTFSPNGEQVATASFDDTARVWNANSDTELVRLNHDSVVQAVAFSPDGERVATASGDATARIWDAASGTELARLNHDSFVQAVTFSPDGERVVTASLDDTARVWDAFSGTELARLNHDFDVQAVAFSPDGKQVATASLDKTARLWDAFNGMELARLNHDDVVQAVTFSPNGERVATASGDATARIWDVDSGVELVRLNHDSGVQSVAFSPDGERVATASFDATARVWDVASGTEVARLNHDDVVQSVTFSPDGERVATASLDAAARVWDADSGVELARLNHDSGVQSVAFSPDGKRVATASWDATAQVRYTYPEDLIAQACQRLTRNLTILEWQRYLGDESYRRTCSNLPYPDDYEDFLEQQSSSEEVSGLRPSFQEVGQTLLGKE
ncbi:AAA-like domain-containing protein [Oscillatoria sp. CS-180]|uniref:AAA-like domain-containing protein n=1 Tax=Oscillatoria sp. CS-180 TaxID=3021720 RepID=UPI00232C670D|nr:AAA-like domain-containing protein [Oscillatoria sp. CS-180]MDB9527454.1 AAA-like domain-containing protein [Oscillatoria sp. CS-180]